MSSLVFEFKKKYFTILLSEIIDIKTGSDCLMPTI